MFAPMWTLEVKFFQDDSSWRVVTDRLCLGPVAVTSSYFDVIIVKVLIDQSYQLLCAEELDLSFCASMRRDVQAFQLLLMGKRGTSQEVFSDPMVGHLRNTHLTPQMPLSAIYNRHFPAVVTSNFNSKIHIMKTLRDIHIYLLILEPTIALDVWS